MNLDAKIESVLFYKNEPLSLEELASFFDTDTDTIRDAVTKLEQKLHERGVTLVTDENGISLGTSPAAADLIEKIKEEEINKDLTKAELETLTIILYRGPLPKSEIDYIRGVNASTILRKLRIRGLIDKQRDPESKRRFLYKATNETLRHLGITSIDELPEYDKAQEKIEEFKGKSEDARKKDPFT